MSSLAIEDEFIRPSLHFRSIVISNTHIVAATNARSTEYRSANIMSSSIVRLLREDYAPDSSTPMLRDNSHASNFSTASPRISEYEPEDLEDGIGGGGATRENDFNSHSINSGRKKRFCRSFSRRSCTFMILLVMFSIVLVGSLSSKRGKDGMRDFRSRLGLSDERSAAVYDELKRYSWAKSAISTMEEEDADGKVNMSKEAGFDKRLVRTC